MVDSNILLGALLVIAGLGDIGIGVLIGSRMQLAGRLAIMGGGVVIFVAGLLLSTGLLKLL